METSLRKYIGNNQFCPHNFVYVYQKTHTKLHILLKYERSIREASDWVLISRIGSIEVRGNDKGKKIECFIKIGDDQGQSAEDYD